MNWIIYLLLTAIFYVLSLAKLKTNIEKDYIRTTPLFIRGLIFFAIFEWFFIESILSNFTFHLIGLVVSFLYPLSMYIYLKNQKKEVDRIFEKLLKENQNIVSLLSFIQATNLSKAEAEEFLDKKLDKLQGIRTETVANIYYNFERLL